MDWKSACTAIGAAILVAAATTVTANAAEPGHYLFAWAGDLARKGDGFIAVIDADPASPTYGQAKASAASGIPSQNVHHTEYVMPQSGLLFANDHTAGRTAVMDLRDPLHPKVAATFGDLGAFSHPHSFLRLPNGNVMASFQFEGHAGHQTVASAIGGVHGGVVEIDEAGRMIRSASTADPSRPDDLLLAYSLLPLPAIDRLVVTNSSMNSLDRNGYTYQVFRLSDLKLLSTEAFDAPPGRYGELNPEEARLGPDGSVYVQTLGCGIERIIGLASDRPRSKLVHQFPGSDCGVPTIVSHYLLQSVPALRAVVVLDIASPEHPMEVARVVMDPAFNPHWTAYDPKTRRVAVTGGGERLFMLTFDPATGALALDRAFHDGAGNPGFDFRDRAWPHGWTGTARPHGVVFTR